MASFLINVRPGSPRQGASQTPSSISTIYLRRLLLELRSPGRAHLRIVFAFNTDHGRQAAHRITQSLLRIKGEPGVVDDTLEGPIEAEVTVESLDKFGQGHLAETVPKKIKMLRAVEKFSGGRGSKAGSVFDPIARNDFSMVAISRRVRPCSGRLFSRLTIIAPTRIRNSAFAISGVTSTRRAESGRYVVRPPGVVIFS